MATKAESTSQPRADGTRRHRTAQARHVLEALRRIVRELRRTSSEAERNLGLSAAQLLVLQLIAEAPGCSVNELAARTNTDQSSVSVVARRLVLAKLAARTVSASDGRRVELRLTAAGQRLIARQPEPAQLKLFQALDRLKDGELDALTVGLGAVVREMHIADAPPSLFFEDDGPSPKKQRLSKKRAKKAGAHRG